MKVITVIGEKESGKSSYIKYIFLKLLKKGGNALFYETVGADKLDFHAIMLWKKRMIAFCSAGDVDVHKWNIIEDGVKLAEKTKSDVLINALSTTDFTVSDYELKYNIDYEQIPVKKYLSRYKKLVFFKKKVLKTLRLCKPEFWKTY